MSGVVVQLDDYRKESPVAKLTRLHSDGTWGEHELAVKLIAMIRDGDVQTESFTLAQALASIPGFGMHGYPKGPHTVYRLEPEVVGT